jgi:GTP-binding protein LepA
VVPVLNKIDLPQADPERPQRDRGRHRHRRHRGHPVLAPRPAWASTTCWKLIVAHPAAQGRSAAPLKALIIDSWFDNYVGVVMLVRVVDGTLKRQGQDAADVDRLAAPGEGRSACSRRSR